MNKKLLRAVEGKNHDRKPPYSRKQRLAPEARRVCKCECGGTVRGVEDFGRLWTWCEKCTPVVTIAVR